MRLQKIVAFELHDLAAHRNCSTGSIDGIGIIELILEWKLDRKQKIRMALTVPGHRKDCLLDESEREVCKRQI